MTLSTRKQITVFAVFFWLALSLMVANLAVSGEAAGTLNAFNGVAKIQSLGQDDWSSAPHGQVLSAGDRVRVSDGNANVRFANASLFILGKGEVQIPLVGGESSADALIGLGQYRIAFNRTENGTSGGLTMLTPFGEVTANDDAVFTVSNEGPVQLVSVNTGSLTVAHTVRPELAQRIVASGSSLAMNASGMGPATGLPRPQYVAMSDVN
ncbi:MAG: hypothetical protein H6684_12595 [Deltaproteobacteria bacterium]|nr:hypothetical protein [bacterium]MCB9476883.1 hypothetical protein [Deltaproteobacteria bacterium]MCB9480046.1 hypothetical protein [Deltaproteobacteria bacterium]MCB9489563.1 hypothetical protein [Deltaproteobacteria bacterium]